MQHTVALKIHASCGTSAMEAQISLLPPVQAILPEIAFNKLLLPEPVAPTMATAEEGRQMFSQPSVQSVQAVLTNMHESIEKKKKKIDKSTIALEMYLSC